MPVVKGQKSESEKFAGALRTYSIEALMGDGRALQAGTSHNLGQNFAKAFDITFQARDKSVQHVWGTSWGVSTRLVGGVIMTHGDDSGLVLPPLVAPYQVVIVPIGRDNWRETVLPRAQEIQQELAAAGIRVTLDEREERPGWKFAEWELRGVPLRVEIGPKDIEKSAGAGRAPRHAREAECADGRPGRPRFASCSTRSRRTCFERALKFREEHTQRVDDLRRVQAGDGRPSRLRDRAVVRLGRLRGADQDRHAGDDPQHADRRRRAGRRVRPLRQPGDRRGVVREELLEATADG